jgi:succinate dehydrogenase / fumarate reductase cytochrome b subunit
MWDVKDPVARGYSGDKAALPDALTSTLGTENEAVGTSDRADRGAAAMDDHPLNGSDSDPSDRATAGERPTSEPAVRPRPRSPNIQIYRPQLTSVLSILNRITGIVLSASAIGLVAWLIAAATGPQAYGVVQGAIVSWIGQFILFTATFAYFLHLCGGIRHLVWDTVHGFELRSIYISGWAVVVGSVVLTLAAWILSLLLKG